jgi:uncharacterized protein YbjT (DUF2867 family)
MAKRLCIIGGSGFVGRAIVREAVRCGHEVTVACRHPERARDIAVEGVRLCRADITSGRGLDEALANQDVAINLVGLLFEKGRQTFQAAHTEGTARVLASCKRADVGQYLHMSALGAGKVENSQYAQTKAQAESLVRASDVSWTIFRPSIIYGDGDSFFNKFKDMSRSLPILPVIAGNTRFQPVWVEDVARAFVASIGNVHVAGQTYELGGPRTYSFRELLAMLMQELGRNRLLIDMPMPLARLLAIFGALLPTPPLTTDQLRLLKHDNIVEGEAFPRIFGRPAELEIILPTFIHGNQAESIQQHLDEARRTYRKGGI